MKEDDASRPQKLRSQEARTLKFMAGLGLIAYITIGATATMLFKDLDIEHDQVKLAIKWLAFPALFVLFCIQ